MSLLKSFTVRQHFLLTSAPYTSAAMLLLQALTCLYFGVALTNAQATCNGPSVTFMGRITKAPLDCTNDVAGDSSCEAAYPGYMCADQTSNGAPLCCGMQAGCDAGYVAHFDRNLPDFFTTCTTNAECGAAGLAPSYVCQGTAPDMFCCTPQQPPPANCNTATQVDVNGVCQPITTIGGACVDSIQCPPESGALCDIGVTDTCICPAVLPINVNGVCMGPATIGAACSNGAQCTATVAGSTCNMVTMVCECAANSILDNGPPVTCTACPADKPMIINGKCYAQRTLGQSCPGGVAQCPSGAVCQYTCVCPMGTMAVGNAQCIRCDSNIQVLVGGICYNKAKFGATCTVQEQCTFLSGICSGSTCACTAGSLWDGNVCQSCSPPTKVLANNVCYDMSNYGASCVVSQQCSGYTNGICTGGQCLCTTGTAWNGASCAACGSNQVLALNQCLDKVSGGTGCSVNEQCGYTNGACNNKICGCTGTLVYSSASSSCVCDGVTQNALCYPYASRGQACSVDSQCTKTAGTKCINFICDCPTGTTFNTVSCTSTTTGPVTTTCLATEVRINDLCYPLLNPNGYYCYYAQQCSGGSTCTNYICTCPANLPAVSNNVCAASTTSCSGNTVLIKGNCVAKTTDGTCLSVNCLSTGNPGCVNYAPYSTCKYNSGNSNYYCC